MCDPLTIVGIALTAGSIVANQVAVGQQSRARDNILAAERIRQNGFDQQAQALNQQSQDRYVGFEPQQEARSATLGDALASTVGGGDPNSGAASIMPSSASNVVNQERDAQIGEAQSFVDQQTGALADLRSFGDLLGETSLMQGRDASQIAQIGGFKRGSQDVVPLELNEAAKAGDNFKLLADILAGTGTIATGAGIGGGSASIANMFGKKAPIPMARPGGAINSLQVT